MTEIVLRHTGEIVDPEDAVAVLAKLREIQQLKGLVAEAERALGGALVAYRERTGSTKTVRLEGGGVFVIEGGPASEWRDPGAMRRKLIEAGMPEDSANEIVMRTIDYKVDARRAKAAADANPAYRAVVEAHTVVVQKPYRARPT